MADEQDSGSDAPTQRGERNALKRRREQVREASRRFRERKKHELEEIAVENARLAEELSNARLALGGFVPTVQPPGPPTKKAKTEVTSRADMAALRTEIMTLRAQLAAQGSDAVSTGAAGAGKYGTRSRPSAADVDEMDRRVGGKHAVQGLRQRQGESSAAEGVQQEQYDALYAMYDQAVSVGCVAQATAKTALGLLHRVRNATLRALPSQLAMEIDNLLHGQGRSSPTMHDRALSYGGMGGMGMGIGVSVGTPREASSGRTTPQGTTVTRSGANSTGTSDSGQAGYLHAGGYQYSYGDSGSQPGISMGPMGMGMVGHPAPFLERAPSSPAHSRVSLPLALPAGVQAAPQSVAHTCRAMLDTATKDICAFAAEDWPAETLGNPGAGGTQARAPVFVERTVADGPGPASRVTVAAYARRQDLPIFSVRTVFRVEGVPPQAMAQTLWLAHTDASTTRQVEYPMAGASTAGFACRITHVLDPKNPSDGVIAYMQKPAIAAAAAAVVAGSSVPDWRLRYGLRRVDCMSCSQVASMMDVQVSLPPTTELDTVQDQHSIASAAAGGSSGRGSSGRGSSEVESELDPLLWLGIMRSVDEETGRCLATGPESSAGSPPPHDVMLYGGWIVKRAAGVSGAAEGCIVTILMQLDAKVGSGATGVCDAAMQDPATAAGEILDAYLRGSADRAVMLTKLARCRPMTIPPASSGPSVPSLKLASQPFPCMPALDMQSLDMTPRTVNGTAANFMPSGHGMVDLMTPTDLPHTRAQGEGAGASTMANVPGGESKRKRSPDVDMLQRALWPVQGAHSELGVSASSHAAQATASNDLRDVAGLSAQPGQARKQTSPGGPGSLAGSSMSGLDMLVQFLGPR